MDVTDKILEEITPDPFFEPLPPTVEELEEYAQDLDCWGNQITLEWATNEIKNHQYAWVKQGLVADRVCRYRLYKPIYPDWNAYCKKVMGREKWRVNKLREAAKVTLELFRQGFKIVPACQAQAEKVLEVCEKTGQVAREVWQKVLDAIPEAWMIGAPKIAEVFGMASKKTRITLPTYLRERMQKEAFDRGISVNEMLREDYGISEESVEAEIEEVEEVEPDKIEAWEADLEDLVREYDSKNWLLLNLIKLFQFGKSEVRKVSSQFSWLHDYRSAYQT